MKRLFIAVLIVLCIMAFAGCAHKQVAQSEQPATVPSATSGAGSGSASGGSGASDQSMAKSDKELGSKVEDIHFDFDKSDIRSDAKPVLKSLSNILSSSPATKVVIEGNCDERGTSEYNLALGDRRANSAKTYLISLGIPSGRLKTISYGKEKPLCTDATEECWAKNRRDHFVLTEGK